MAMKKSSTHVVSLTGQAPGLDVAGGRITEVDASVFPILERLSVRRLLLEPRGVREPHWHANCHELGYCVRGDTLVTIFGNESARASFTIAAGEMFFVPSGALHHIENTGQAEAEFILGFSHERPEDFGLSGTFGAMTDAVLGNTYNLPASAFAGLARSPAGTGIGRRQAAAVPGDEERHVNPHKFAIEAQAAPLSSAAGSARLARKQFWPILQNIAMYSLRLTDLGMREPHWHPGTAEMGYVVQGRARMTVLSPGASVDTYELKPGDIYFIPRAYPHHIEDIGEGDIHFLIFFDRETPGDIGCKASVSAYSREVLAATFGCDLATLPPFPFTAQDPLIVPRGNPVGR
jgi:oxalate decarboxylase